MSWIFPVIAGFAAGMAGAMGLGGGFVLMLYLTWTGISAPEVRAANLLFFIPTAFVSMLISMKSGLIDSSVIPYAAAAGSIGAVLGLLAGSALDAQALRYVFALLLIAVGVRELFHRKECEKARSADAPK